MVWAHALWKLQDWNKFDAMIQDLSTELPPGPAPDQGQGWKYKAQKLVHAYLQNDWGQAQQLFNWWAIDPYHQELVDKQVSAIESQGYSESQPHWTRK